MAEFSLEIRYGLQISRLTRLDLHLTQPFLDFVTLLRVRFTLSMFVCEEELCESMELI